MKIWDALCHINHWTGYKFNSQSSQPFYNTNPAAPSLKLVLTSLVWIQNNNLLICFFLFFPKIFSESKIVEDVFTSKPCFDQISANFDLISPNVDLISPNVDQITSSSCNSCMPARVRELLSKHNSQTPLIPNDVTFNLLRIQSSKLSTFCCY